MPTIPYHKFFDGAEAKLKRMGLDGVLEELEEIITGWELLVIEQKGANGGAALRKLLDARFEAAQGWIKRVSGDIDHTKCLTVGGVSLCVGVEIQVSARSDLIAVDLLHLKQGLRNGMIDIGVLIVPTDRLATFLPSRFPSVTEALRILDNFEAEALPLILWGIEHDGPYEGTGSPLPVRGRASESEEAPVA